MDKSADAFRTISEVSEELDVPKHVLRFWEARFPQIKPMKRGGGRRYYRPEDVELLQGIRHLLHAEGYTIRGVQKILRLHGIEQVKQSAARAVAAKSSAPTQARSTPGKASAKAVGARTRRSARGGTIGALQGVIAELEALRGILRGEEPVAAPVAQSGGTRRARAAR